MSGYISRKEVKEMMLLPVGKRAYEIRNKLNKLYNGEFTKKDVAEGIHYSQNGYAKIERGITKLQTSTVESLQTYFKQYNVPNELFIENYEGKIGAFYLGKEEDKLSYFNAYYLEYGQKHYLDSRQLEDISDDEYLEVDPDIDITQDDVIEIDEGQYRLSEFMIDIIIEVKQPSTGRLVYAKRINNSVVIEPSYLMGMEKELKLQVSDLLRKYEHIESLKSELSRARQRENMLRLQLYREQLRQKE